jgi:[glutamine synthetase] adenylyltransferase / [glutamine synthetase]-adenylyl-L-tyrosine phosphorylase
VIPIAEASLTEKVRMQVAEVREQLMFGVIGYGKLGGRELSYRSDLDLVFLFDCDPPPASDMAPVLGYYHSRLAQRVMHVLNTTTRAGILYETDLRLRPSGRSGTMVSSLKAFNDYQRQQAWTWEHQALVRSRMITGPEDLVDRFEGIRAAILSQPRDIGKLKQDVVDMRRKMSEANSRSTPDVFDLKLGEGGLVDIEFLVQYQVLAQAASHPDILRPRGTLQILDALAEAGIMAMSDAEGLQSAYRDYLANELDLGLQELPPLLDSGDCVDQRAFVTARWRACF